jgi:4-hydroxybenzoate polyprenyltransferase
MFRTIRHYLELIKFSHSIFALPFALISALIAFDGKIDFQKIGLVILAMVFARSAAMAFNLYIDRDVDAKNPRTKSRHLPAKILKKNQVLFFIVVTCALFVVTAYFINALAFKLALPALLILFFYSFTKRFTSWSHLFLGMALAVSPVGAWVAIRGEIFNMIPLILFGVVLFWVAGFDILYSLQDFKFDKKNKLFSIPAQFGIKKAILISRFFHLGMFGLYCLFLWTLKAPLFLWVSAGIVGIALIYQHSLVKDKDLSHLDMAFFSVNGYLSLSLLVFFVLALFTF